MAEKMEWMESIDKLHQSSDLTGLGEKVKPGVRYPIEHLFKLWKNGYKDPLNKLLKAFQAIQKLSPVDDNSFQKIASYHGRPFIERVGADYGYWGGYCMHGNVLFPLWHRAYVNRLEKALQTVEPGIMMPYWDELSPQTLTEGVPEIFTMDKIEIDNEKQKNPLKSFRFPYAYLSTSDVESTKLVRDPQNTDEQSQMYTTVRFPLFHKEIGSDEQKLGAKLLNESHKGKETEALNKNVVGWFSGTAHTPLYDTVADKYLLCLKAPNYTVFSNTTSMNHFRTKSESKKTLFSLESPHNDTHLSVGAMEPPSLHTGIVAFGDMGYNEIAAFDPIFFFHHCFVDRMFWLWQKKNDATEHLVIEPKYPGTSSSDEQGPTPGTEPKQQLDLDTPLYPFLDARTERTMTGNDIINLTKLGISYPELIDETLRRDEIILREGLLESGQTRNKIIVSGVDRTLFRGPFVVLVNVVIGEEKYLVGHHSVFNRLESAKCANCMTNRYMTFVVGLERTDERIMAAQDATIDVEFRGNRKVEKIDYEAVFSP